MLGLGLDGVMDNSQGEIDSGDNGFNLGLVGIIKTIPLLLAVTLLYISPNPPKIPLFKHF
jgi:hypothetical protein